MIKTLTIGKRKIKLDGSIGWTIIYRNQFGHDILPTLMPLLMATLDVVGGLVREIGTKQNVGVEEIAAVIGSDGYVDAMVHLSGLEVTEIMYITWAMAKRADDTLDDPDTWINSLDSFPIDDVAPVLFDLITRGFMSSKNLKRLQTTINSLRPSTLTRSSSQDSREV